MALIGYECPYSVIDGIYLSDAYIAINGINRQLFNGIRLFINCINRLPAITVIC